MTFETVSLVVENWWGWVAACLPGAVLLYVAAELFLRRSGRLSPVLRYGILWIVLLKFLVPAPWSLFLPQWSEEETKPAVVAPLGTASLYEPMPFSDPVVPPSGHALLAEPRATAPAPEVWNPPAANVELAVIESEPHWWQAIYTLSALDLLFVVYCLGLLICLSWVLFGLVRLALIVTRAKADEELAALCARLCVRMEMRMPRVRVSRDVAGPLAGGLFSPYLLVPEGLLGRTEEQKRLLLLHELAHLKRRDPLKNWIQVVIGVICWWNPMVARTNHLIRREREHCCDDIVLRAHPSESGEYPKLLLDVAEHEVRCRQHALVSAFAYPQNALAERIRRMLMYEKQKPKRLWFSAVLAILFATSLLFGVSAAEPESEKNRQELAKLMGELRALQMGMVQLQQSQETVTEEELDQLRKNLQAMRETLRARQIDIDEHVGKQAQTLLEAFALQNEEMNKARRDAQINVADREQVMQKARQQYQEALSLLKASSSGVDRKVFRTMPEELQKLHEATKGGIWTKDGSNLATTYTNVTAFYTVEAGDTLSEIAEKHGMELDELKRINNKEDDDIVRVGEKLNITPPGGFGFGMMGGGAGSGGMGNMGMFGGPIVDEDGRAVGYGGMMGGPVGSATGTGMQSGMGMGMGMGGMGMGMGMGAGFPGSGFSANSLDWLASRRGPATGMGMMGGMGMMEKGSFGMAFGDAFDQFRLQFEQSEPVTDFHLEFLDGEKSTAKLDDRLVIVYYWRPNVLACRSQLLVLEKMAERYKDDPILFLALHVAGDPEEVKRLLEKQSFEYLRVPLKYRQYSGQVLADPQHLPFVKILKKRREAYSLHVQDSRALSDGLERIIARECLAGDERYVAAQQMQRLARALRAFKHDAGYYPEPQGGRTLDTATANLSKLPGFEETEATLDAPVNYVDAFPDDPFAEPGMTFRYFSTGDDFVIVSDGPDGKPDYDERTYDGDTLEDLQEFFHDPQKGPKSGGDIIFVGP